MAKASNNVYAIDEILSPEAKDSLKHLELYARRMVQGMLHGAHRSKRKGYGDQFDHHKNYQPGDPLKHIDWKVSARHDRFYVKRYLEQTALRVRLVVDRSASMMQASGALPSKYFHACRMAACLAYLVMNKGDSVGAVLAAQDQTTWLPVKSTDTHLVAILRALASRAPAAQDNLGVCLRTILDRGEPKGLVVLVSDLMFDPKPIHRELARLCAQGHEVMVIQLRDPTEEDFPFNRWVQFHCLENASVKHRIDTVPLKKIYHEEYQAVLADWKSWSKRYNVHFVSARTEEHVETVLSEYIAFRSEIAK